jgi:hypothetical protein
VSSPHGWVQKQTLEQGRSLCPGFAGAAAWPLGHDRMHLVPNLTGDDGLVLTGVSCALVHGITDVDAIGKQLIEPTFVDELSGPEVSQFCKWPSVELRL